MPPAASRSLRALALSGWAWAFLGAQAPIGIIISEQSRTAFTVQGAGARAMGLGGAFIAVADDATAVSFNPAGLAQLLKPEISFVGRGVNQSVAYEDVAATAGTRNLQVSDSLISSSRFDPLLVSAIAPIRVGNRTLALQLSLQRLIALGEKDSRNLLETPLPAGPASNSNHLFQSISQSGQIDIYALSLAYELSQRVLVGISANLWRGNWDLDSRSSKTTPDATSYVNFSQSNRMDGSNYNLGLLWRWPTWNLGLVHRTAFRSDYAFGTTLETSSQTGGPVVTAPIATGLHWPSTTGVGLSYRPREGWLVTSDLTHTPWSQARYMTPRASLNGQSFFDLDKGSRTPDATCFHFGVEHLFITRKGFLFPLRMGFSREPQPVVDRVTLQQRVIYGASLGSGLKFGDYTLDLAYRYGWGSRQSSQFLDVDQILSKTPPTSLGTERVREHRLDLSFIVQFERQPLERALHHLFVGD